MNILLVDDTEISLTMAKTFIEMIRPECIIEFARTAEEAIELANNTDFKLIITDLCMPGLNGDQMAKTIKTSSLSSGEASIFICSSREPSASEQENIKLYSNGFLPKPLTASKLQDIFTNF